MTYSELELVYMLVSAKGTGLEVSAYIDRESCEIFIDNIELNDGDEVPPDLADNTKYARVPSQEELLNEMELMRLLVQRHLSDTEQNEFNKLSSDIGNDEAIKAGIQYLNSIGKLTAWRHLISRAQEQALRNWAASEKLPRFQS